MPAPWGLCVFDIDTVFECLTYCILHLEECPGRFMSNRTTIICKKFECLWRQNVISCWISNM